MAKASVHEPEKLTRYAFGDLESVEENVVREHVARCPACEDYVSFVTRFNTALSDTRPNLAAKPEACPDGSLIVDLEAGDLDAETAKHVHAHILFCTSCREEFYALRRLRNPHWARVVIDAARGALTCAMLIGSAELAEPAYAGVRDEGGPERQDSIHVQDTVIDPGSGESSQLLVGVEQVSGLSEVAIVLSVKPPRPSWRAVLLDADAGEIGSAPLANDETPIGSGLPYGRYGLNIRKEREELATFAIEVRAGSDS